MDLNSEICNKNYRKRQAAVQAMAGSGDKAYLPLLLQKLSDERNPEVKAAFIVAIGKLGSRNDIDAVAPFLDSDNNRLRSASVKALTYLKDPKLRERVYPLLCDPENLMISLAVKVLWNFDPEGLVAKIKEMLASPRKDERKAAVWALSELQYSVAKPLLEQARFDNSISVRFTANDILIRLEENLAKMREAKKSPEDSDDFKNSFSESGESLDGQRQRDEESGALNSQANPSSVPTHLDRGVQPTPISRAKAAFAGPKAKNAPQSREQSLDLAEMLLERAEKEAARTLSLSPISFDELAELLDHRDPAVRIKVIKTFESSGNPSIIPALKRLAATERNSHVSATVVKALGILGSDDSVDFITPHLRDPDPRVVANAIEGLANHWSPKVAELVKPFLTASKPRVQASALLAVATHDEDMAMKQIEKILESGQKNDRKTAVRLLGEIDSPKAIELLQIVYMKGDDELQALSGQIINNVRKVRDRVLTLTASHRKVVDSLNTRISEIEASEKKNSLKFSKTESALVEALTALESRTSTHTGSEGTSVFDNQESSGRAGGVHGSTENAVDAGTWRLLACALLLLVGFQQIHLWYGKGNSPASNPSTPTKTVVTFVSSDSEIPLVAVNDKMTADNVRTAGGLGQSSSTAGPGIAQPPQPGIQLSEENLRGLEVISSIFSNLGAGNPSEEKIRQVLQFHLPRLQEFFYMGETYIMEDRLKNGDTRGAVEELEKMKKYITEGYILWDFQKGEWISPRED